MMDSRAGTLGTLLKRIRDCGGTVTERDIELHPADEDGGRLYACLRDTANSLLNGRKV